MAACRPSDGGTQARSTSGATGAVVDSASADALLARADAGRIQGDTAAPVWIIEVSDFECPFCKRWHDETYPAIKREYVETGIVRMAYLNLPLGQHKHALPAALAAMCASAQGRFWQTHDAIFATQERWTPMAPAQSEALFDSLAVATGINKGEYDSCRASNIMRRLIEADRARAQTAGVGSTPSFFIGNEGIAGAAPIENFRAAIARARAAARPKP